MSEREYCAFKGVILSPVKNKPELVKTSAENNEPTGGSPCIQRIAPELKEQKRLRKIHFSLVYCLFYQQVFQVVPLEF